MSATWHSRRPEFERRLQAAQIAGVVAMQQVVVNAVKRALRGGYTTGDFVTGLSLNSVSRDTPREVNGEIVGRVGTPLAYNAYWELGHYNVFTRRYERVEKWRPAMEESRDAARAAFVRAARRAFAASAPSEAAD